MGSHGCGGAKFLAILTLLFDQLGYCSGILTPPTVYVYIFFFSPNNCTPLCQPMQKSTCFLCSCIGGRSWHLDWTRHGINMPIQFLSHHATLSGNSPSLATAVIPAPFLWRGNEEETGDRESTGDDSHIKHNLHFWQWGHFWTAEKMAKNLNTFISL